MNGMSAITRLRRTAAGHQAGVIDHFFQGDAQTVFVPLHHHAERVADQQAIDPGRVEQPGHGVIVGGQHRQPFAAALGSHEVGNGHRPEFARPRQGR